MTQFNLKDAALLIKNMKDFLDKSPYIFKDLFRFNVIIQQENSKAASSWAIYHLTKWATEKEPDSGYLTSIIEIQQKSAKAYQKAVEARENWFQTNEALDRLEDFLKTDNM